MRIGVIMGGISSEREISLRSGQAVIEGLANSKYEAIPIVIDAKEDIINKVNDIDFALLMLHGSFGEDGTVQSVLQTLNIPYSGCGPLSSSICMDKDISKQIIHNNNIRTAKWVTVKKTADIDYDVINKIGYPVFVKPNNGGSSVATSLVEREEDLLLAVEIALNYDTEVMIEEYIEGDEITCPVFNNELYPIIAIKPKGKFFDIESKYSADGAEEFIIKLEEPLASEVKEMALKTYRVLKCDVYARVDMIIKNNVPYILEVNTLPGMTQTSLFPKSAQGNNISFTQLIENIIETSLNVQR